MVVSGVRLGHSAARYKGIAYNARADGSERQLCDVGAGYALGIEDYRRRFVFTAPSRGRQGDGSLSRTQLVRVEARW